MANMRTAGSAQMEDATLTSFEREAYPNAWDYDNITHLCLIAPLVDLTQWNFTLMQYCIVQKIAHNIEEYELLRPMRRGRFYCEHQPRPPKQVNTRLSLTFDSQQHLRTRCRSNARSTPCGHMTATFARERSFIFNRIPATHPFRIGAMGG